MKRLKRVDEELSSFIMFGGIMNTEERRIVAELLFLFLYDPQFPAWARLQQTQIPTEYPNWAKVLQRLFTESELTRLTRHNEDFALSVARETLNWCKTISLRFEHAHSFADEQQQFQHLQQHYLSTPPAQWGMLLPQLQERYPNLARNWTFYEKTLQEEMQDLAATQDPNQRLLLEKDLNVLKQNILRDWAKLFADKKEVQEEAFLETQFTLYHDQIMDKAGRLQEMSDQLAPFYNFLGHAWNDDLGAWNKINWEKLEEYAESLQRDRQLRELAELLGRWQEAENELKEQKFSSPMPKEAWKPNPYGKSEIIGIHHSDNIGSVLPSEIALLSSPETEVILAKKYAEKKLLTFQHRSEDVSHEQEMKEMLAHRLETDKRGPMIMLIDTSGSMFGAPERIAKALALAILNIAMDQERRAFLISFSTGIQTLELTGKMKEISGMVDFLKMSFHGGTDLHPAMEEAMRVLQEKRFQKADVLVISDFVIPRLDKDLYQEVQEARTRFGTHFHSLFITRRPDPRVPPLPIFDNHWLYDLDNPRVIRQTIDHFQMLK